MDLSLLVTSPSSPSRPQLFFTQFTSLRTQNPRTHLRFSNLQKTHHQRRLLSIKSSAKEEVEVKERSGAAVFGGKKELSGIEAIADSLSPPIRLASSVIIVAASIAAGYGLGSRFGASTRNAAIGAAGLGAAGVGAAYALNACVPEVAAVNLHNLVAGYDDPTALEKEEVEAIENRYGVNKQDESFKAELCDLYSRFVSSVLPPGSERLKGNEAEMIIKFKNALGIDDPDAANVHMEIGRRIFRQRLETGDREADSEQRRAFQKLIYVSTLVFGGASTFLLPWKRVFKVTDSQVEVAIRDNAQGLYAFKLKSIGRDVDEKELVDLRGEQLSYKLSDEIAADMFMEHVRKLVEENVSAALELLKSRTRAVGATNVTEELDKILAFNNRLMSLSSHPEIGQFARGIGPVSLMGGEYDGDRKMNDLKLLYRAYATESFVNGRIDDNKVVALNHLKNIFGLGKREAENILLEVTSKVYRKRLGQAFTSGALEAADSKAAFLQSLCEELHFDPQKASEIHEEIYRQKLQQCVADGALSEEDVSALLRLRVMLCIPQKIVEAAHTEICGSLFEKVVRVAVSGGIDGYDAEIKASVQKAAHGLRLTREASLDIASKAVRNIFKSFVSRARSAGNRTETAKELKKMIAFNTMVVTDLVATIKGEPTNTDTAPKEAEVVEEKKDYDDFEEEVETIQTIKKTRPDKELQSKLAKPSQTEINLKDDLSIRERIDLYKTYLMFCITGEVSNVPFGVQISTKKDNSDYLLLNHLGGILGLSGQEIVEIHRDLAEQAFRKQADVILADGQLTKEKVEQLNEVQKEVGLPAEYAQKVIKSITSTKMSAAIETAVSQGKLSIKQMRELKEASVDLDTMISLSLRENLFKKTVDEIFSSGTGEFDEKEVYESIPSDLSIDAGKAKKVVHELARTRLSNSLIQAVSLLRQRNRTGVVSSINDLLACDKAVPAEPLSWEVREELADLFAIYLKSNPTPEKLSRLQYLLGITDEAAAILRDVGDKITLGAEEEEFVF